MKVYFGNGQDIIKQVLTAQWARSSQKESYVAERPR